MNEKPSTPRKYEGLINDHVKTANSQVLKEEWVVMLHAIYSSGYNYDVFIGFDNQKALTFLDYYAMYVMF